MNFDLKELPAKFLPLLAVLRRYAVLIFILCFLGVYVFLVMRINSLSQVEPGEDLVAERLSESKQLKIDQSAVDKIKQLQGQNVEVQTLFKQARDNPFSE